MIIVLSFVCFAFCNFSATAANRKLLLVHMVYRHGDRSPTKTFPNDQYQEDYWPQGFGQLTTLGMQQHYNLGQLYKRRYMDDKGFMNTNYSRYEISVRSTDMDRTLMSAQADLSGLYPPSGDQVWSDTIAWQPIPVHTVTYKTDSMLNTGATCPAYYKMLDEARASEEMQQIERDYADTVEQVGAASGLNTTDIFLVTSVVPNALFCEVTHNLTKPDWVTDQIYADLQFLNAMDFRFKFYTPEMSRIRAGVFLNELLNQTKQKASGVMDERRKMFMYSAHDTTLAAILSALGLYPKGVYPPTYASNIIFELYEDSGKHTVTILFKNDTVENPRGDPVVKTLPGCEEPCPLEDFIRIVTPKTYTQEQWLKACDIDSSKSSGLSAAGLVLYVIVGVSVFLLVVVAAEFCYRQRYGSHRYQAANFGSMHD